MSNLSPDFGNNFYDETRDMLKRAYAKKTSPKPIETVFVR